MWPLLLDLSKDECRKLLRTKELEAYSSVITAFRAQGDLTKDKKKCLMDLCTHLGIAPERHKAEIRRAVNDEKLATIADQISGSSVSSEWLIEGKRLVPLMPRLVPQTAFTSIADNTANVIGVKNAVLPSPSATSKIGNSQRLSEEVKSQHNFQNMSAEFAIESEPLFSKNGDGVNGDLQNIPPAKSVPSSLEKESLELSTISSITSVVSAGTPTEIQPHEKPGRRKRSSSVDMQGIPAKVIATATSTKLPTMPSTSGSRTVSIPLGGSPVHLTLTGSNQKSSSAVSSAASTPQKVILVSTSCSNLPSSLLQRTVGVPIVKTVATTSTTVSLPQSHSYSKTTAVIVPVSTHSGSIMAISNSAAGSMCTFSGGSAPKLTVSTTTTPSVSNKLAGRQRVKQGILVPVVTQASSSTSSGKTIQLKPGAKPSFHIKEGSGLKIIAQSVPVTGGTKMLTKTAGSGSGSPIVVVTKTASINSGGPQGTRVVNVLSTQAGGKVLSPTSLTLSKSGSLGPTFVTVGSKGKQAALVKVSPTMSLSSGGKPNVIVVQKAHMLQPKQESNSNVLSFSTASSQKANLPAVVHDVKAKVAKVSFEVAKSASTSWTPRTSSEDKQLSVVAATSGNVSVKIEDADKSIEDKSEAKSTVLADLLKDAGILPVSFEDSVEMIDQLPSRDHQSVKSNHTIEVESSTSSEKVLTSPSNPPLQSEVLSNVVSDNSQTIAEPIASFSLPSSLPAKSLDAITVIAVPEDNLNLVDKNTKAVAISEGAAVVSDLDQGELDPSTGEFYSTKTQGINLINSDVGATSLVCDDQLFKKEIPVVDANVQETTGNSVIVRDEKTKVVLSTEDDLKVDVVGDDIEKSGEQSSDLTAIQSGQMVDIDHILITENCGGIEESVMCEEVPFGDTAVQMEDMMEVTIEDMASEVVETSEAQVVEQNIEIETTEVQPVCDLVETAKNEAAVNAEALAAGSSLLMMSDALVDDIHVVAMPVADETDSGDEGISANLSSEKDDVAECSGLATGMHDETTAPMKRKRKPVNQVYSGGNLPHLSGWARLAMGLLLKVMKFRGTRRMKGEAGASHWFLQPVTDDEAPGYSQIVKIPMDFSTIKKRLETQFYEEISEFHRDMILIKHNCELYNPPDHEARLDGDEVFSFYQQEYERLTEKWIKTHLMSPQKKKKT